MLWLGCQQYQWTSSTDQSSIRTLAIDPVVNESYAPQVVALLTRDLRDAFLRDGAVRVVGSDKSADARLAVTIIEFDESYVSGRDEDDGRPSSLSLRMTVRVNLISSSESIESILPEDWTFSESIPIYADPSIRESSQSNLPQLTSMISRRIRDHTLYPWKN
jgi:hypothetical protein